MLRVFALLLIACAGAATSGLPAKKCPDQLTARKPPVRVFSSAEPTGVYHEISLGLKTVLHVYRDDSGTATISWRGGSSLQNVNEFFNQFIEAVEPQRVNSAYLYLHGRKRFPDEKITYFPPPSQRQAAELQTRFGDIIFARYELHSKALKPVAAWVRLIPAEFKEMHNNGLELESADLHSRRLSRAIKDLMRKTIIDPEAQGRVDDLFNSARRLMDSK